MNKKHQRTICNTSTEFTGTLLSIKKRHVVFEVWDGYRYKALVTNEQKNFLMNKIGEKFYVSCEAKYCLETSRYRDVVLNSLEYLEDFGNIDEGDDNA